MSSFPLYGCLFCSKHYVSEARCGQHLDGFLSDYCTAYSKAPTTRRLLNHPVAAIRAVRINAHRRPGKKNKAVVWNTLTVEPVEGVEWDFVVLLNSPAELIAFQNRPPRTAEQWLVNLRAIPVEHDSSSSSASSLSSSDDDDEAGDNISADGSPLVNARPSSPPPTITITPTPAARVPRVPIRYSPLHLSPTPSSRRRRLVPGLPRCVVLGHHGIGMEVGTSNVTVEQRDVVPGGAVVINAQNPIVNSTKRKRRLDDIDPYSATSSTASSALTPHTSDAAFRARWGIKSTPSPAPAPEGLTLSAIRRTLNPHAVPAPVSPNAELMSQFFTPGNVKPGYFEVQVATTQFRVWVDRETRLRDVLRVVEKELLAAEGWPGLVGMCYVGREEDGVWDEDEWEVVKREGRARKEGVVEVELVF